MAGHPAYAEYMDSGVEWLDSLPAHWGEAKIKFYYDIQLGRMLQPQPNSTEDEEVDYLKALNVQWEYVDFSNLAKMWTSPKDKQKYAVRNGDLLICEGGEAGRTALLKDLDSECIIQNALHRVRGSEKACIDYLKHLMRHIADAGWFDILCNKSTIAHLTGEKLGSLGLPLPSIEEQQAIAHFLDYKTAQIDALIAKKEALLAKLAEKRTALISHAVTKGLDPSAPMKDSGSEWIGEVPAHWRIGSLGYVVDIVSGGTPDRNNPEYWGGSIPWIKTGEINYQDIYEAEEHITEAGRANSSASLVPAGTLLMAMYGQGNTRGRVSVLGIESTFNQACLGILPHNDINVRFLYFYLTAAYKYIRDSGNESSQMNLSAGVISKIKISFPCIDEQQEIVLFLNKHSGKIDQQKLKIEQAIDKLKEYRTALITNAVTGKIDVRNVPIPVSI